MTQRQACRRPSARARKGSGLDARFSPEIETKVAGVYGVRTPVRGSRQRQTVNPVTRVGFFYTCVTDCLHTSADSECALHWMSLIYLIYMPYALNQGFGRRYRAQVSPSAMTRCGRLRGPLGALIGRREELTPIDVPIKASRTRFDIACLPRHIACRSS